MDIKKLSEEYRQVQQIRSINKLAKKAMAALVQFNRVQFQKGLGPCLQDITIDIRKGCFPDLGVIVFHKNNSVVFTLLGPFIFNDKLDCDAGLKIIGPKGEDEDITLIFPNKNSKEECVGVLTHYLGLSNCSTPEVI